MNNSGEITIAFLRRLESDVGRFAFRRSLGFGQIVEAAAVGLLESLKGWG